MRVTLETKKYTQIPQLSASKQFDLKANFTLINPHAKGGSGKKKALMIGINYVGQQGELKGCHNDVESMKRYIVSQGYAESDIKILLDDNQHTNPTLKNILEGMAWLVANAQSDDSLFMHYSGIIHNYEFFVWLKLFK